MTYLAIVRLTSTNKNVEDFNTVLSRLKEICNDLGIMYEQIELTISYEGS